MSQAFHADAAAAVADLIRTVKVTDTHSLPANYVSASQQRVFSQKDPSGSDCS